MGIYGFLSAAYQETANKAGNVDAQVTLVEVQSEIILKNNLLFILLKKKAINKAVADLRAGLAGNVKPTKIKMEILSTHLQQTVKHLKRQLDQAIVRQTKSILK
jgi:hypothetical protein